jgi:hypothetical protein
MEINMKTVTTLVVINNGDIDVGLGGFNFEIEVKEKYDFFDEDTKNEFIGFMKEKLKEFCEIYDGQTTIQTQEELDFMIDIEIQRLETLNEGE